MNKKYKDLRRIIEDSFAEMIRIDVIPEDKYLDLLSFYNLYEEDKEYVAGDLLRYDDELYEVIHPHTSQEDWIPYEFPALYKRVVPDGIIPMWVQPLGLHDAYQKGDKVIFEDKIYESTIDSNTWSPDEYGWVLVE